MALAAITNVCFEQKRWRRYRAPKPPHPGIAWSRYRRKAAAAEAPKSRWPPLQLARAPKGV